MRLRIPIINLLKDAQQTFLTNDFAAGSSSLTVQNIYGFAVNQILFIGNIGNESSEIIHTHSSTAPTGSTITLASATTQNHSNSDYVSIILYDQVEISYAVTATGTKTVITTIYLDVDDETIYDDSTATGYYFIRYKNSITSTYSTYSDPIPITDYPINSARYLIDSALMEINKTTSPIFSDEYGFKQLNNGQLEVLRELKRWSWMAKFNSPFATTSVGTWKYAMPTDIDDPNTNKSIYNLKMGNSGNLIWADKEQWNNLTSQVNYGTLSSVLQVGDSTVTLTNSKDFDSSGTISIGDDNLTFSANNKNTGVLTLSANSTVTYPTGTDVFMGATYGTPSYYTTYNGYIYVWPIVDSSNDKENFYADYYSTLTPITTDTQTIIVPDPMLIKNYLIWKFLLRMNGGAEDDASTYAHENFDARLKKLKQTEVMGRRIRLVPRYNDYGALMSMDGDSKFTRTQGFWPNNF
jgi:hypothetical protein